MKSNIYRERETIRKLRNKVWKRHFKKRGWIRNYVNTTAFICNPMSYVSIKWLLSYFRSKYLENEKN